jgi:UDP-N-acetylmuramoyl-tripeptide--D-alanyl-D-alanine ligase
MEVSVKQFLKQQAGNKVVILGDMLELGKESHREHAKLISEIETKFETIILVGPEFTAACKNDRIRVFKDTDEAGQWIGLHPIEDAHILIKGSRGIALEKLLTAL